MTVSSNGRPAGATTGVAPSPGPGQPPGAQPTAATGPAGTREGGAPPGITRHLASRLALLTILLVLLGAAAGFGVAALVPPQFAARADVLYQLSREQPTGFLREDRNMSTQLVLLTSRTVLGPVAAEFQIAVDDLADSLTATVAEESEVIQLEYRDTDPDRAVDVLGVVVEQYLVRSNNDERADVRNYLDGELIAVLARVDEVQGRPDRLDELGPLVAREQQLRTQLDELQLSDLTGPGARVLVAPYTEVEPVSPRPRLAALTGGLSGLLLAALAVAVVVRRRTMR